MTQYNSYQSAYYSQKYGKTYPKKKAYNGLWKVTYGEKVLATNLSYPLAQEKVKEFRMMGIRYPNKELIKIEKV